MNRKELMELAKIRLKEARALIESENYDGAYYLFGYVVECGLKACIAKKTKKHDFPDKETVNRSYTHSLTTLVEVAGLEPDLDREMKSNPRFAANWAVVKDWSENSRYEKHARKKAQDLRSAIVNQRDGVLRWIRHYW